MKTKQYISLLKIALIGGLLVGCATASAAEKYEYTTEIPEGILTPDKVETSIGTLDFTDGVPSKETAEKAKEALEGAGAEIELK